MAFTGYYTSLNSARYRSHQNVFDNDTFHYTRFNKKNPRACESTYSESKVREWLRKGYTVTKVSDATGRGVVIDRI